MKNYLISNFLNNKVKEYIFIILTATILLIVPFTKSYSEEKVFSITNLKIQATVDLNFSRDKYIKSALHKSFDLLMSKILLSKILMFLLFLVITISFWVIIEIVQKIADI